MELAMSNGQEAVSKAGCQAGLCLDLTWLPDQVESFQPASGLKR